MILDKFNLATTVFQINFKESFLLWDRAGAIASDMSKIWPDLKVAEGMPDRQTLRGKNALIQTTMVNGILTLKGEDALSEQSVLATKKLYEIWREQLDLSVVERISTRTIYHRDYGSLGDANRAIFARNLAKLPEGKVFDQPTDSPLNGVELRYRFEDDKSFAFVRLAVESFKYEVELDPAFVEAPHMIKKEKHRVVIDFDRGMLGGVDSQKFRVDEWFKGYQHIINRDLEKVLGS